MKSLAFIIIVSMTFACTPQNDKVQKMQATIDSLQKQLNETYKPGFDEFMSGIQTHHTKLWFAGLNQNWELANFELHEIIEVLQGVQKFSSDRQEIKSIGMINPVKDSVSVQPDVPEKCKSAEPSGHNQIPRNSSSNQS